MAKLPEMTPDFARWYAETFMDEGAKRDLRWKGVVEVAAKASHETIEVLIRLAFQTSVSAAGRKTEDLEETYSMVISTISGGDITFDPLQSKRELQILAAATLARLLTTKPDAVLTVTTASFGGSRQPNLPMDLSGLAEKELTSLSDRKHARSGLRELKVVVPEASFVVAPEAVASMTPEQLTAQFDKLHATTSASIKRVVTEQNRVFELLHQRISLDEEELQMLWWLLGGYSRHFKQPFEDIGPAIKPLILAYELGQMTSVSPGPASIRAMLLRAGVGTEKLKLIDAVNSVDTDWAIDASNSKLVSPVTTPIHYALEQRAELDSTDAWQAGWSGLTGLAADAELTAIKLAELFYREHLFLFLDN